MQRSLPVRVRAVEATIAKYSGQPFAWGSVDCLRVVAFCLRELGFSPPLREAGSYTTHRGAKRALRQTGCIDVAAWIDRWGLHRIPAAAALPGDIAALPSGDDSMPSLAVVCSGGRYLMFAPQLGSASPLPLAPGFEPLAVWSV